MRVSDKIEIVITALSERLQLESSVAENLAVTIFHAMECLQQIAGHESEHCRRHSIACAGLGVMFSATKYCHHQSSISGRVADYHHSQRGGNLSLVS